MMMQCIPHTRCARSRTPADVSGAGEGCRSWRCRHHEGSGRKHQKHRLGK